jgi:hypothetical protein
MTSLCMHPRSHPMIAILDARTRASTHPCVRDLIQADWGSTCTVFGAVMLSQQLVIERAAAPAHPPPGSRFEAFPTLQFP